MANGQMDSRVALYSKVLLPKSKERICGAKCGAQGAMQDRLGAEAGKTGGSGAMLQERVWKGSGSRAGSDSYCGLDLSVCFMCE